MPTPRLPVANPDEVSPEIRDVFDNFMKVRGNIPNMFRTLAVRPEIMVTAVAHMNAVLGTGTVAPSFKEMLVVRTSAHNKCAY
jgi:hypothetical protein